MIIVIDLSKKLVGFNLFEPFFYQFKKDKTLIFANNPLTVDDNGYDYNELKSTVQNILFDNNSSSWSLCVIYDMNEQCNNPLQNSINANIHRINKYIIEPLAQDYSFGKLYYLSLDDIKRNYDGIPFEDNIRLAIEFDSKGYITEKYNENNSNCIISKSDFKAVDDLWETIRQEHISQDGVQLHDSKKAARKFSDGFKNIIKAKTDCILQEKNLSWYKESLEKASRIIIEHFEDLIFKNSNSINSIENPSELMKSTLKSEVSSYKDQSAIIIHYLLNDKESNLSKQILTYRKQLEIIGLLVYLATNDTKLIFGNGQTINRENHWEVHSVLNDDILSQMLVSYNSNLKLELEKLGKFASNEIEYEEYAPRIFNLSSEMTKPKLPAPPVPGMFSKNVDTKLIEDYAEQLYQRYLSGIECANKRIRDLTTTLRIQKEAVSSGTSKKGSVAEISAELDNLQKKVSELHERIAFYRPKEAASVSSTVKIEYNEQVEKIKKEMNKRIKGSSVWKTALAVFGVSVCTYPILQFFGLPNWNTLFISLAMMIVPTGIYLLSQVAKSIVLKKRLIQLIGRLTSANERTVNSLFSNDNNAARYVQDIYDLIMLKKYINECNTKIIASTKKFKNFNYHHDNLKEHIEASEKLMEVLCIDINTTEMFNVEKMSSLEGEKNIESNPLYCPISYLKLTESIKNKAVVNDQQNVDIDSNTIGFIDKFIISYDKEYRHD